MQNTINLSDGDRNEIKTLIAELTQHKTIYKDFKNFVKTSDDALKIAAALLDGDYKTFKTFKLKYSNHAAEKMKGIQSLSTYKKTSSICKYLSSCGGICAKCYAEKSIKLYKSTLTPVLIYNTLLLKYVDIDAAQIPYINDRFFRFESFSDLQGSKHFKNLLTICKKNKNTIFTLWTKAGKQLYKYMDAEKIYKLPNNLNIVISEFYINETKYNDDVLNSMQLTFKTKNALKVFTVFDDEKKRAASNQFLCKNKCINCLKCYKKSKKIIYIAEKIH